MTPDGLRELVQAATPGPWEHIVEVGDEWWFGDGNQARVRASDDSPWNTVAVMFCRDDSPDARLIALAPELATLLAGAMEVVESLDRLASYHDLAGHELDVRQLAERFDKLGSGQ